MRISHSKLKTFRRCHKEYDYKYNRNLRRKWKPKPLYIGSVLHLCIEYWVKGEKPWKAAIEEYRDKLKKLFVEERVEYEQYLDECESIFNGYIRMYSQSPLEYEYTELMIEVPIPDLKDFSIITIIDGIVKEDKRRYIMEHKNMSKIPDETNRMSDVQTAIYWWVLPLAGYPIPHGTIWDYLRTKPQAVPEVLKKGGLTKRKNIDTTWHTYKQAILDNGLDPKDYEDMREVLQGKDELFYRRVKVPFSQYMVDQLVLELKQTAMVMSKLGHIVTDRNMTRDCPRCGYFNLCQAELRGHDTDYIIEKEYEVQHDPKKKTPRKRNSQ